MAEQELRNDEMIIIISPEVPEENIEAVVDKVNKLITDKGGVISEVEQWGKRKLAYPIRRFAEGNYVLVQFTMKPESGRELEAKLRISEETLRHLLIRVD